MANRSKTTPQSTAGSFSPSTGARSRVQPDVSQPAGAGGWGATLDDLDALAANPATSGADLLRAMDDRLGGLSHLDDRGEDIVVKDSAGGWAAQFNEDEAARYDRLIETVFARFEDHDDPYDLALDLMNERAGNIDI